MIQCKLCGTPLTEDKAEEHKKQHHSWFSGDILKK